MEIKAFIPDDQLRALVEVTVNNYLRRKFKSRMFWRKFDDRIAWFMQTYNRVVETKAEEETSSRAGEPWEPHEDRNLSAGFELFLNSTAKRHKRTVGAIRARIEQKLL